MSLIARFVEERLNRFFGQTEPFNEQPREIFAIERRGERKLRIVEFDIGQLNDSVGNLLIPVPLAALNHADGEPMKRDVENVLALLAAKPGRQAAKFVMPFKK